MSISSCKVGVIATPKPKYKAHRWIILNHCLEYWETTGSSGKMRYAPCQVHLCPNSYRWGFCILARPVTSLRLARKFTHVLVGKHCFVLRSSQLRGVMTFCLYTCGREPCGSVKCGKVVCESITQGPAVTFINEFNS